MKNSGFASLHPAVSAVYFIFVLILSATLMHPACLVISLFWAFLSALRLGGRRALRFALLAVLPMMLLSAVLNPAFNHMGQTILTYLPGGNPLTAESLIYGAAAALMLGAVLLWCFCLGRMISSDKLVFLLGRFLPSLALLLSMTLRFIPGFIRQLREVSSAQKGLYGDFSTKKCLDRIKTGLKTLSTVVSRSLEDAVETADSMAARGYGLPGRTAFLIYRFTPRDSFTLALISLLGILAALASLAGGMRWDYFPAVSGTFTPLTFAALTAYFALCAMPMIFEVLEDRKWRKSELKI